MTAEQHLARAVQAQQQGRGVDVVREAQAALELRPDHPIAHNILGMEALGRNDLGAAEAHFDAATRADPSAAALWLNLAKARRLQGSDDGERAALESALETDQLNLNALIRLAELHERRSELGEATIRWGAVAAIAQQSPGAGPELRAFFDDAANAGVEDAFALLGMKKEEKTIFAPRFEDGMLKQEVAQTAVNFSDHRLVAPAATEQQTRLEIGRRIIRRLAQVALERIIALDEKAVDLQQQKGYLGTRLRMLHLARDGMEGIVDDPATIGEQIRAVERSLKETVESYIETKSSLATLDGYIGLIDEVFSHPEAHVTLTQGEVRINRAGIKVAHDAEEGHHALTLAEITVGEKLRGVIALVRCPRSELPPKEDLIAKAERYL